MATRVIIHVTAQPPPLQNLEIPMNLRMTRVSQKTGSMEFKIKLAFRLFHLANRSVCSLSNWYVMKTSVLTACT